LENLIKVYENPGVILEVRRQVDRVSNIVVNTEKLEMQIYKQLENYYREREKISFKAVQYIIGREINRAKQKYRTQNIVSFSDLTSNDFGESEAREFEPEDALAGVEMKVESKLALAEIKKALSSLATTERDTIILNELCEGCKDTQIAKTLASLFGGKMHTHRQYVSRFRTKCKDKLGLAFAA